MPLVASCDALYFPEQPRDNVITLRWKAEEVDNDAEGRAASAATATPLDPSTALIFKVKSTAPQLFHVRPHYGALLLADPTAMATAPNFHSTHVQFGLRSNYSDDGSDAVSRKTLPYHGNHPHQNADGAHSTTPSRHQERFVVDYAVVKSEQLAYQQIAQAYHNTAKLMEVVKSVWALISSGAVARSHVGLRGQIGLKVYMSNVFLSEAEAKDDGGGAGATAVVVPPHAKLVPCTLVDRVGSTGSHAGRSPQNDAAEAGPARSGASNPPWGKSPPRKADALRSLKEEVKALRQEVQTPQNGSSVSSSVTPTSRANRSPAQTSSDRGSFAAARQHLEMRQSDLFDSDDILMRVNLDPNVAASPSGTSPKKRKGVKLYMLLGIMFAVYLLCMLTRRGGSGEGTQGPMVHVRTSASEPPKRLPPAGSPGVTSLDL